jgi:hypothetical protein
MSLDLHSRSAKFFQFVAGDRSILDGYFTSPSERGSDWCLFVCHGQELLGSWLTFRGIRAQYLSIDMQEASSQITPRWSSALQNDIRNDLFALQGGGITGSFSGKVPIRYFSLFAGRKERSCARSNEVSCAVNMVLLSLKYCLAIVRRAEHPNPSPPN